MFKLTIYDHNDRRIKTYNGDCLEIFKSKKEYKFSIIINGTKFVSNNFTVIRAEIFQSFIDCSLMNGQIAMKNGCFDFDKCFFYAKYFSK